MVHIDHLVKKRSILEFDMESKRGLKKSPEFLHLEILS